MLELWGIFVAVFLAELGDKTQLATLLFAGQSRQSPWLVFAAASAALVLSTGLAVLVGQFAGHHLQRVPMKLIAGCAFLLLGGWILLRTFRG